MIWRGGHCRKYLLPKYPKFSSRTSKNIWHPLLVGIKYRPIFGCKKLVHVFAWRQNFNFIAVYLFSYSAGIQNNASWYYWQPKCQNYQDYIIYMKCILQNESNCPFKTFASVFTTYICSPLRTEPVTKMYKTIL